VYYIQVFRRAKPVSKKSEVEHGTQRRDCQMKRHSSIGGGRWGIDVLAKRSSELGHKHVVSKKTETAPPRYQKGAFEAKRCEL